MSLYLDPEKAVEVKDFSEDIPEGIEFEARIGEYTSSRFEPGIRSQDFFRVLAELKNSGSYQITESVSEVKIYGPIRVWDEDDTTYYMKKERVGNVNIPKYGVRLSKSKEEMIERPRQLPFRPDIIRNRKRVTFQKRKYQIDMTQVNEPHKAPIYEIEVEYLIPNISPKDVFKPIKYLLKLIQNSPLILSIPERNKAIAQFNQLFANDITALTRASKGAFRMRENTLFNKQVNRPQDLTPPDLPQIMSYAFTDKADGKRKFLFVGDEGVYLLNPLSNEISLILDDTIEGWENTLLDGEMLTSLKDRDTLPKNIYLAFDTLFYKGVDVRQRSLVERLDLRNKTKTAFREALNDNLCYLLKYFFYEGDYYMNVHEVFQYIDDLPYENDGVIMTPIDSPYLAPPQRGGKPTYKWKPHELLTIDFLIKKIGANEYEIYVYERRGRRMNEVKFRGTRKYPFSGRVNIQDDRKVDGHQIYDGQIVEFQWKGDHLEPYKIRSDKIIPNALRTAQGLWTLIHNPVTKQMILGESLTLMRRYHNKIKKNMLKPLGRSKTILDIGSGKGGDLLKWKAQNLTVYAVDPSEEHLRELVRRVNQAQYSDKVTPINIGAQETQALKGKVGEVVDAVTAFFSLTFFFENEDLLDRLMNTFSVFIKPETGLLIGTVLDGKAVLKALKGKEKLEFDNWTIHKDYKEDGKVGFGKKIKIDIQAATVHHQTEYLFDFDIFREKLEARDFELVSTEMFNPQAEAPYLDTPEMQLSSMNRKFVFRAPVVLLTPDLPSEEIKYEPTSPTYRPTSPSEWVRRTPSPTYRPISPGVPASTALQPIIPKGMAWADVPDSTPSVRSQTPTSAPPFPSNVPVSPNYISDPEEYQRALEKYNRWLEKAAPQVSPTATPVELTFAFTETEGEKRSINGLLKSYYRGEERDNLGLTLVGHNISYLTAGLSPEMKEINVVAVDPLDKNLVGLYDNSLREQKKEQLLKEAKRRVRESSGKEREANIAKVYEIEKKALTDFSTNLNIVDAAYKDVIYRLNQNIIMFNFNEAPLELDNTPINVVINSAWSKGPRFVQVIALKVPPTVNHEQISRDLSGIRNSRLHVYRFFESRQSREPRFYIYLLAEHWRKGWQYTDVYTTGGRKKSSRRR